MAKTEKKVEAVEEVEAVETPTKKAKKSLTVKVNGGQNDGLVRTFAEGEEDAAESFKQKFNGEYI